MINIVCLKWGTKYGPEYVNRLYAGIKRNTTLSFTLHCFTDNSEGINPEIQTHKLQHYLTGWWHKLFFFSNEMPIKGRIVYMDLDTLITGNIDEILSYDEGFVVLRDFYTGIWPTIKGNDNVGSGLMSFNTYNHAHIWRDFIIDSSSISLKFEKQGDQAWIQQRQSERLYWQDIFPGKIVSFKVHCNKQLAPDARIVCYHGRPSIPESITNVTKVHKILKDIIGDIQPAPWVAQYWKE